MENDTDRKPIKTVRGRVVYHRKKHEFSYRDVLRLIKRLNKHPIGVENLWKLLVEIEVLNGIAQFDSDQAAECRDRLVQDLQTTGKRERDFYPDFSGGGEFGGGGATRPWRPPWRNPFPTT